MHSGNEKNIRLLPQKAIDPEKWDRCISGSPGGLIYARSFYLNRMAKNWDALVLNDYEAVMPLPWKRKYGIRYLYQPPFTAQLGIFSTGYLDGPLITSFIYCCEQRVRFCEMHLNHRNGMPGLPMRVNYTLNLSAPYEEIRKGYKKNLLKNLKETGAGLLSYKSSANYQQVINLYRSQYGNRFPHVTKTDYRQFSGLCLILMQQEMLLVRQVFDASGTGLLGAAIFFRDRHRIYNIMPVTLPEGRQRNAFHFLLDQLIREFAGQPKILDFEGSEIAGIAEFYRKFGSVPEPYPFLRFNRLPFPLWQIKNRL